MAWYTGNTLYDSLLILGFALALFIFVSAKYGTSTYGGRFGDESKEFKVSSKAGWIAMELPSLIFFPIFFFAGSHWQEPVPLFLAGVWMFHYTNRALVAPMLMREKPGTNATFGISVIVTGWAVLMLHSYLNGYYFSELGSHLHTIEWFSDPRFIIGLCLYAFGFTLNVYSDFLLRNLRSKTPSADEPRYKIPFGGLFKYVSSPQYLGEIISFLGLSVMTWGLGFVYVLLVTAGNLIPRAIITHRWYQEKFADYPADRKAIFPKVL